MKRIHASRKYILPIALAKTALVLLILQLFFTSCSKDELLYNSTLYSEGPLVEVEVFFGDSLGAYTTSDTIYLEIPVDGHFTDELSGNNIFLNDAEFTAKFCFINDAGEKIMPQIIADDGDVSITSDNSYEGKFGYIQNAYLKYSSLSYKPFFYFRIGCVFSKVGHYTLYFKNTPNHFTETGEVDIVYNMNGEELKYAYAFYLFDTQTYKSQNYTDNAEGVEYNIKNNVLKAAGFDQAITDFTIIE